MAFPANDVYFHAPGVASVQWDRAGRFVFVEWQGWANSAEFGALLEAEIRALTANGGSSLLADCRLQKVLSPADQDRANEEWMPRALAAGLKRFAVVLPESVLASMNIKERLAQGTGVLQVAYFDSVDEAREWLAE